MKFLKILKKIAGMKIHFVLIDTIQNQEDKTALKD